MFRFAIEHVSRVSRIIAQPGGNAMLIGVGGSGWFLKPRTSLWLAEIFRRQFENHQSGRSSAAKLATFIQDYECFQLEITRTYSLNDFKDDMKKLLLS